MFIRNSKKKFRNIFTVISILSLILITVYYLVITNINIKPPEILTPFQASYFYINSTFNVKYYNFSHQSIRFGLPKADSIRIAICSCGEDYIVEESSCFD